METPFIFGKIATEKNFTDREMETANLVQNFTSLINTIIISPRRWGKSSLVNKAAKLLVVRRSPVARSVLHGQRPCCRCRYGRRHLRH